MGFRPILLRRRRNLWGFSATFAFCVKAPRLATFFIAPKNCIFWCAPFEPIKNLATLGASELQGFHGTPLFHCYTLRQHFLSAMLLKTARFEWTCWYKSTQNPGEIHTVVTDTATEHHIQPQFLNSRVFINFQTSMAGCAKKWLRCICDNKWVTSLRNPSRPAGMSHVSGLNVSCLTSHVSHPAVTAEECSRAGASSAMRGDRDSQRVMSN